MTEAFSVRSQAGWRIRGTRRTLIPDMTSSSHPSVSAVARRAAAARPAIAAGCLLAGVALLPPRAPAADPPPNAGGPAAELVRGWCGDGGPATRALLYAPSSVSAWSDGSYVVMDA